MFSAKVQKWNKFNIKQDRNLIITNLNVYNFKKKSKFFTLFFYTFIIPTRVQKMFPSYKISLSTFFLEYLFFSKRKKLV